MKLIKKVYTTISTDNLIDRSFNELKKEKEIISTKEFFKLYERLFFDIPPTGLYSHTELVEKSSSILDNDKSMGTKQQMIDELNKKILNLETKIIDLEMSSQIKDLGRRIEQSNQGN
jgi:uncharacterized protein YprB with RNaseH-like and TPR domain